MMLVHDRPVATLPPDEGSDGERGACALFYSHIWQLSLPAMDPALGCVMISMTDACDLDINNLGHAEGFGGWERVGGSRSLQAQLPDVDLLVL
jgi:hypothetical protein